MIAKHVDSPPPPHTKTQQYSGEDGLSKNVKVVGLTLYF